MKKIVFVSLVVLLGSFSVSKADFGITFSNGVEGDFFGDFLDENGDEKSGMFVGLVIDISGDGFSAGSYVSFDPSAMGYLSDSEGETDDYFVFGNSNFLSSRTETFDPGISRMIIDTALNIPHADSSSSPVNAGMNFGVIWFSTNSAGVGDWYGFLDFSTPTGDVIPSDGATVDFSLAASSLNPGSASFQVVPEPATYALLAGLLGLGAAFARRRR